MRAVLRAGADKVSLNTAAVARPDARQPRAPRRFGSPGGRRRDRRAAPSADGDAERGWEVVVRGGREATGLDAVAWADAGGRARRRRAARHLDRPRRDRSRLRHGAAPRDHDRGRACRSSPRAAPPARPTSWPRSATAAPTRSSRPSIFHRREHSIAAVKAAMAAAGLPVRPSPRSGRVTRAGPCPSSRASARTGSSRSIVQDAADGRVLMLA